MSDGERYPISYREYVALRQLFGITHIWDEKGHDLEKRLRQIPNGWRDARMIHMVSEKLLIKLLGTVPEKKLEQLKKELNNTYLEVTVKNLVTGEPHGSSYTYVETKTLERVTDKAMEINCAFCQKKGKEVRDCQLRKNIERMYNWDFPQVGKDEECHFLERFTEDFDDAQI